MLPSQRDEADKNLVVLQSVQRLRERERERGEAEGEGGEGERGRNRAREKEKEAELGGIDRGVEVESLLVAHSFHLQVEQYLCVFSVV